MREDQIDSAGVNVERLAQVMHGHGGTLNVPAWTPVTEGRFPIRLGAFTCLPKHKVAGIGLVIFIYIDASPSTNAGEIVVRELTVRRKRADAEVS